MRIWHRVGFVRQDGVEEQLQALCIENLSYYRHDDSSGHVVFDISEDDSRWPAVRQLYTDRYGSEGFVGTEFTDEEILACEWVRLCPGFERYYPQPERNMAYVQRTFRHRCASCGIEFDQFAPFRIRQEAKLGRYEFVTLYWTYGIFCTQRVVEAIEAAEYRGIDVWPVMLHKADVSSETLSQLVFPYEAGPGLPEEDKQEPEPCDVCKVTKYAFHTRGYMHLSRTALRQDVDGQRTQEWFGSDTRWGYQEILISNRFARLIIENDWKGVVLKGVELI